MSADRPRLDGRAGRIDQGTGRQPDRPDLLGRRSPGRRAALESGRQEVASWQLQRAKELKNRTEERRVEFEPVVDIPGVAGILTAVDGLGKTLGGTRVAYVNDLLERAKTANPASVGEARDRASRMDLPEGLTREGLEAGVVEVLILARGMRNKWRGTEVTVDHTMEHAPNVYPAEIRDNIDAWREGADLAGSKSVIIVTDQQAYDNMTPRQRYELMRQHAEHINKVNTRDGVVLDEATATEGAYTAPDSGTHRDDMTVVGVHTDWVSSQSPLYGGSGEPSPITAAGIVHGLKAMLRVMGRDGNDTSFAIKGAVGAVASDVARELREDFSRAELLLADRPEVTDRTQRLAAEVGGSVLHTDDIIGVGDIYIPGAMGSDLTAENLAKLRAGRVIGVLGPANGIFPLGQDHLIDEYFAGGGEGSILVATDFIENQGGIGQCMQPLVRRNLLKRGYEPKEAARLTNDAMMKARVADIGPITEHILSEALRRHVAPDRIVEEMILEAEARRYIRQGLIPANA